MTTDHAPNTAIGDLMPTPEGAHEANVVFRMPPWIQPMAATLTQDRFTGDEWLFERKYDGIRLLAFKRGAEVTLYSRNRLVQHLPAVAAAVAALPIDDAILDGELTRGGQSGYHVFDLPWLDGHDLSMWRSSNGPCIASCATRASSACHPQTFTLRAMGERLDAVGDLWADLHAHPCALPTLA